MRDAKIGNMRRDGGRDREDLLRSDQITVVSQSVSHNRAGPDAFKGDGTTQVKPLWWKVGQWTGFTHVARHDER